MTAAANRAKAPKFAAAMDDVRAIWPDARVRFVQEGDVTLGAMPLDPPEWMEIDGATYVHTMRQAEYLRTRKGKRGDL